MVGDPPSSIFDLGVLGVLAVDVHKS